MTPLLSTAVGLVIAALTGLLLLALAVATVLLVLLTLLVLDHLVQRSGVDRRAAGRRAWSRMRGPGRGPRTAPGAPDAGRPADAEAARTPRVPFSARRPRPSRQTADPAPAPAPAIAVQAAPTPTGRAAADVAPASDAPAPSSSSPEAPPATVTQVLPAAGPTDPAAARAPRAPAPRARTARVSKPALRGPAPAPSGTTASHAEPRSGDRDSAIDRLFAPLLEPDRTEETPRPRSARRPDGEA